MLTRKYALSVIAAVSLLLCSCSEPSPVFSGSIDGPVYNSIDELMSDTQLVVSGVFEGDPRRVLDIELGIENFDDPDSGTEMDLWPFRVKDVIVGEKNLVDSVIHVTQFAIPGQEHPEPPNPDETHPIDGVVYTAADGRSSLLFLRPYPQDGVFAITGLGAGSFEILDDGTAVAPRGAPSPLIDEVTKLQRLPKIEETIVSASTK